MRLLFFRDNEDQSLTSKLMGPYCDQLQRKNHSNDPHKLYAKMFSSRVPKICRFLALLEESSDSNSPHSHPDRHRVWTWYVLWFPRKSSLNFNFELEYFRRSRSWSGTPIDIIEIYKLAKFGDNRAINRRAGDDFRRSKNVCINFEPRSGVEDMMMKKFLHIRNRLKKTTATHLTSYQVKP